MSAAPVAVTVGEERTEVVVENLRRTQIVMYAGAGGDFNPLHTDEPFATQVAGHPTVMSHGMLVMGLAGQVLVDWFGTANVRRYRARFQAPTWPGDTLTVTARIDEVRAEGDEQLAEVTLTTTNQDGRAVLGGSATVVTAGEAT
ncbi:MULTISPECIES: MaoC/PaaZ C-terminal domain-containing protein [Pseudonocardia]|uniref:Bifunctional enoyl-CoA hydratase/phosphate acetyltransferase n=2 Tax=Pseudonocardia TaxID=1847 RepID=A0A1Y2MKF4_PSEAH|nr:MULTISPECIES: MaoC/PaaZ C-terminal domain-containing protein [Pseudonocardia]OSY35743.1 bifunctional enoyl-CoA hydratase/phosphate acetyltransferase [Pseudonocardia autotrophica]TDN74565.1 acyl dehydratase [Pseudonocardia autotrophica]BBG05333.1 MaoC-like dehydratase [Pseudonocardia autotrophica]GEC27457.1 MaoC-like dehydratase [Pseudonocardia saturnea]